MKIWVLRKYNDSVCYGATTDEKVAEMWCGAANNNKAKDFEESRVEAYVVEQYKPRLADLIASYTRDQERLAGQLKSLEERLGNLRREQELLNEAFAVDG